MSAPARRGARGARWRAVWPFAALGAALLAAAALLGQPPAAGPPLDPRSPAPLGTKALVDVLAELGADVQVVAGTPGPEVTAALVLVDDFEEGQRDGLLDWARDGGTLVVADSYSPLQPDLAGLTSVGFTSPSIGAGECALAALAAVRRVTAPGGTVHDLPGGAIGCFPRGDGRWLVARPEADGTLVTLGGPGTFTNREFGEQDNAVLAAALLLGRPGTVAIVQPPPPGVGEASLIDLIAAPVRLAIIQLLVAFGVIVLWRSRRLGRPIVERQPVEVPGSELVVAVGNLFQASGAARRAGELLRDDVRRVLAERLGLPHDAPAERVARAAAARTGTRHEDVLAVLHDDGEGQIDELRLVQLAQRVEDVRRATLTSPDPADEGALRVQ